MSSYKLTMDQEFDLINKAQQGDRKAQAEIIAANQPLVKWTAGKFLARYARRGNGISFEDLVSEGNVGLLCAVNMFATDSGVRLSAYSIPSVRHAMERYVSQPLGLKLDYRDLKLFADHRRIYKRVASGDLPDDVGADYGVTGKHIMRVLTHGQPHMSIQTAGTEGKGLEYMLGDDNAVSEDDIAEADERRCLLGIVRAELKKMPSRDVEVLLARNAGVTRVRIAKRIGVSVQMVAYIEKAAMNKLTKRARKGAASIGGQAQ